MHGYNKTIAAGAAGALVAILIAVMQVYAPDLAKAMSTPGTEAALQTVITALAVFISPPNNAA